MELRVLRYFLTVAQAESISAAAEVLHVTQPTLSRQLMELEAELGTKLFARGRKKRRMALTEAGSRPAVAGGGDPGPGGQDPGLLPRGHRGGGRRGGHRRRGEPGHGPVARAFQTLHQRHPGILCHLYSGNAQDVTERLDKGLLDFGVLIEPVNPGGVRLPPPAGHGHLGPPPPPGPSPGPAACHPTQGSGGGSPSHFPAADGGQ